jgi:hypothetical protein
MEQDHVLPSGHFYHHPGSYIQRAAIFSSVSQARIQRVLNLYTKVIFSALKKSMKMNKIKQVHHLNLPAHVHAELPLPKRSKT